MGATGQNAARSGVQATSVPIHDIGTSAYLSPDIAAWAAEWGWSNPFAFYFAGRGGMLGDVGPEVVTSAFGWFEPRAVHAMYSEGIGVAGVDPSHVAVDDDGVAAAEGLGDKDRFAGLQRDPGPGGDQDRLAAAFQNDLITHG